MIHIMGVNYYVQEPLKRWLWISMAFAWVLALVYVRILKPISMLRQPYTVKNVIKERGNSWTLSLSAEGHEGIKFRPGQFAWLTIGKSPFSIREHPFSFSSSAMDTERVEMTIKELGDFTSCIGAISPGARAYIDGPYGTFTIDRHKSHGYVFIAGGVGITPILSILKTMRDRLDLRPVILFYGIKTWEDAILLEGIEDLKKSLNMRVIYIPEKVPDGWDGEKGVITAEVMARYLPENRLDYGYFVCGPQPMQIAVKTALDMLGLPLERVQSESFNFV
jgi:predicted ferric reductase